MPIHLNPVSRRRFLKGTLAASAGLFLGRNLLAEEKPVDEHTWALLSDPHIAADREKVSRKINMTEHLKSVTREVVDLPKRPAAVLVNGDCAFNLGEPGDYGVFTDLIEPLRNAQLPIHLTLGNHDDREHILDAVAEAKEGKGKVVDKLVSLIRTPRANWFLLDSLEFTNKTPGLLGEQQLEWLGKALDENKDKPAIVVTHHTPNLGESKGGLKDTDKLLEMMESRKHVKAHIFGHSHVWEVKQRESGLHLINLPAVAYVFKEGQPSGWVLATMQADGLRLKLSSVDKEHKANGQTLELKWRTS